MSAAVAVVRREIAKIVNMVCVLGTHSFLFMCIAQVRRTRGVAGWANLQSLPQRRALPECGAPLKVVPRTQARAVVRRLSRPQCRPSILRCTRSFTNQPTDKIGRECQQPWIAVAIALQGERCGIDSYNWTIYYKYWRNGE